MTDQMVQGSVPAVQNQGKEVPVVNQIKSMLSTDNVQKRFAEVLGKKAPQFMASITNTVAASKQLKQCPATSIIGAAFVAATYDLPIDSNLGFAASLLDLVIQFLSGGFHIIQFLFCDLSALLRDTGGFAERPSVDGVLYDCHKIIQAFLHGV